ncbi:hypothetical protein [Aromatoleum petrolei]|uniref:Zinc-regulated TonB-dependent outer membrane receptor n=1 Tax=Aromatoleum petrolei TaxID=76116 RepID=A0ABX1MQ68_9RHOO|nr:hypothetical protein [Aromatoleum petrolei]NMF90065.1 hypothetical protein [Aromatoleum petrolei]
MHKLLPASLALALATPHCALAESPSDLATLRQEIATMRAAYEARLEALETRLKAAEAAAANSATVPGATAASAAAVVASAPPPPAPVASGGGANAFNPAISLILSGLYTSTSRDPEHFAISGFQLPTDAEVGPGTRGLSLAETELGISANIDPWWRGSTAIALHPDNEVSVEEAYVQTTSLGHGASLKAGRFFSGIGYLNPQHAHTWDFVDNPLAYQALLGTQYGDDGVQLTWLAPIDQYLELGAELGRGRSFPGTDTSRNGAGMVALTAHTGGDIGASHSWRAGLSVLRAKAKDQELDAMNTAGNSVTNAFSGRTRVWVADAVWKWAPNGNATRTSFKLQGEYLRSTRDGDLVYDVDNVASAADYRAVQSGWYLQGIYQFMPGWRVGLRTEQLDPGSSRFGANAAALDLGNYRPRKNTLMFDYNPSEFSRVRLQFARDRSREGVTDNQFFIQYQMSLGAHGAHGY